MASSEASSVGGFLCLECGNQVEIVDGNKEMSIDLHKLTHSDLDTKTQEVNQSSSDSFGKRSSSSSRNAPYTCQICNELVEILYNDMKLSLEIHSKKHSYQREIPSEDQMSNSSSSTSKKSKNGIKVKNKLKVVDSTIIDDAFITLAPCLRAHRAFILKNSDGIIFCNICKINVDILSISDHLETKCHEDNVITLLKNFIPDDLHSSLGCLTFNRFNLVCNLCDCKIDLCSSNPHETIVNIFVHNAQNTHLSKTNSTNSGLNWKADDPQRMLQMLCDINPVISENRCYLDINVQLQFDCKLCNTSYTYNDKDETALLDSLNSHFIGQDHAKYRNAVLTLQSFDASSNTSLKGDHMLIVSKGSIYCKQCFGNIPSDTKLMEEHVQSCPVMRINKNDPFFKQVEEILIKIPSLVRSKGAVQKTAKKKQNAVEEELKCVQALSKEPPVVDKIATVKEVGNKVDDSGVITANGPVNIGKLLRSMPPQFRDVGYIVEYDDGKFVKCLVCDCKIPPSHHNLETHLTGKNHRSNENKMKSMSNVPSDAAASLIVFESEIQTLVDQAFKHLTVNDPVVKANEKILWKCGDGLDYYCTACGDFIPTSTDADRFKTNIYEHVRLEKHLFRFPNQRPLIGTKALPKDFFMLTINELFAALPKDLQDDRRFIKPHRDQMNALFCSLCRVQVPINLRNLQEHLEGGNHSDLLDQLSAPQDLFSKAVEFAVNAIQDAIFPSILLSDKVIKGNEKYLLIRGEHYVCSLCTATIQNCTDTQELKQRFLSHLEGKTHIQKVVTKLMESNPGIIGEMAFVKVKNQTVYCTKCNVALPRAFEESKLQNHVFSHFSGNRHKKSTNSSNIPLCSSPQHANLPKTPNYTTMCNQTIASNKPLTSPHQMQCSLSNNSTNVPSPLIHNATSSGSLSDNSTNAPRPLVHNTSSSGSLSDNSTNAPHPLVHNNSSSGSLSDNSTNAPRPLVHNTSSSGSLSDNSTNVPRPLVHNTSSSGSLSDNSTNAPSPLVHNTSSSGSLSDNSTNVPRPLVHNTTSSGSLSNKSTNAPSPLIDNTTSYGINPVFEAFKCIPAHLQIDIKYIKPGTIPDYLFCTLCSKTINPFYLKDHLDEENHLQEKRIFEERVAHWKMRVM